MNLPSGIDLEQIIRARFDSAMWDAIVEDDAAEADRVLNGTGEGGPQGILSAARNPSASNTPPKTRARRPRLGP